MAREVLITVHSLEIADNMNAASLYRDRRSEAALMTFAAVTSRVDTDTVIESGSMATNTLGAGDDEDCYIPSARMPELEQCKGANTG
jgi:hypothetical protein